MSTRGCYGFRKNGIDKLTYNHCDSYPDCLGKTMMEFCKKTSIKEMNEKVLELTLEIKEIEHEIEKIKKEWHLE